MLSLMAKGFFADNPLLFFPIGALVLFMVVFTGLTIGTLRRKKSELDRLARFPLEDDSTIGSQS